MSLPSVLTALCLAAVCLSTVVAAAAVECATVRLETCRADCSATAAGQPSPVVGQDTMIHTLAVSGSEDPASAQATNEGGQATGQTRDQTTARIPSGDETPSSSVWDTLGEDYTNFYSKKNLTGLAIGLGAAGLFANTSADESIADWYQTSVRSSGTDDVSGVVKSFGDTKITIPVCLGAALIGHAWGDTEFGATLGEWGGRSLRTFLVGTPPMLFFQAALGGSRPEEGDSGWSFFDDNNSVSGHAFVGAVPFLTAAKMVDDPYLKGCFYVGSTLTGLSRINDNDHSFSQVALGWWMVYLAASSVDMTETRKRGLTIAPVPIPHRVGVVVTFEF